MSFFNYECIPISVIYFRFMNFRYAPNYFFKNYIFYDTLLLEVKRFYIVATSVRLNLKILNNLNYQFIFQYDVIYIYRMENVRVTSPPQDRNLSLSSFAEHVVYTSLRQQKARCSSHKSENILKPIYAALWAVVFTRDVVFRCLLFYLMKIVTDSLGRFQDTQQIAHKKVIIAICIFMFLFAILVFIV